jgi:hypothetical protein
MVLVLPILVLRPLFPISFLMIVPLVLLFLLLLLIFGLFLFLSVFVSIRSRLMAYANLEKYIAFDIKSNKAKNIHTGTNRNPQQSRLSLFGFGIAQALAGPTPRNCKSVLAWQAMGRGGIPQCAPDDLADIIERHVKGKSFLSDYHNTVDKAQLKLWDNLLTDLVMNGKHCHTVAKLKKALFQIPKKKIGACRTQLGGVG